MLKYSQKSVQSIYNLETPGSQFPEWDSSDSWYTVTSYFGSEKYEVLQNVCFF